MRNSWVFECVALKRKTIVFIRNPTKCIPNLKRSFKFAVVNRYRKVSAVEEKRRFAFLEHIVNP